MSRGQGEAQRSATTGAGTGPNGAESSAGSELGFAPDEDPFVVQHGGFYRRWFSMIDDVDELKAAVATLTGTTDDQWVPVWRPLGRRHEDRGDQLEAAGEHDSARQAYLQAKTYYAIGRFPGEITETKREISEDCARAYRKACAHLDPPLEVVQFEHQGRMIGAHFRAPAADGPVPAVLIMCGADVFKEDRGWAQDYCMAEGMAALVMDGPGTGENPFPWAPESVSAWEAAVDYLASRPEVDGDRLGAFGISRGGYSVMQLAGTAPTKLGASSGPRMTGRRSSQPRWKPSGPPFPGGRSPNRESWTTSRCRSS